MATKIRASNLHTDVTTLIQSLGGSPDLYRDNASSATTPVATGTNAVAIGSGAGAKAVQSLAIGYDADVSSTSMYGVSVGYDTHVTGPRGMVFGWFSTATQTGALSVGYDTQSTGNYASAIGYEARASATESIALGASRASGTNSFAASIQNNTTSYGASDTNGVSIGPFSKTGSGQHIISIGYGSIGSSNQSSAVGYRCEATNTNAVALGSNARASGHYSLAISSAYSNSEGALSSGIGSIAIGRVVTASHQDSAVFGHNVQSTATNQVSIGGSTQDVRISETYTLPKVDGTSGQVLTTNGSGVSSWATASSGGASSINGLTDGYFDTKNNIAFGNNTSSIYANIDLTATHGAKSNVAMGYNHFSYITSGQYNIAVGNNCLVFNETGSKNTAIGQNALQQANVARGTGDSNVGVGEFAGSYNSTGDSNTFVGHNTNTVIRGGNYQTAIGYNAKVGASGATALTNSRASGTDSLAAAIANNTTSYGASGTSSFAIGYQAKATGAYSFAIDYQSQATGIASRAIGYQAISSGTNSMALGRKANATGVYSYALGWSKSSTNGKFTYGSGQFSGLGDAQQGTFVLRSDTTDATAEAMTTDNSSADTTDQVVLPNNSCFGFTGTVIAREDSSATNDFAVWEIKGGAVRAGSASTTALGTYNINKISESAGATNWSIALSADTTNGAVAITVTGEASHNIRWVATVNTTEVTY